MSNSDSNLIPTTAVRERLGGVSDMTLWRWENDPALAFPEPIRINRRKYWREAEIDAWVSARSEAA